MERAWSLSRSFAAVSVVATAVSTIGRALSSRRNLLSSAARRAFNRSKGVRHLPPGARCSAGAASGAAATAVVGLATFATSSFCTFAACGFTAAAMTTALTAVCFRGAPFAQRVRAEAQNRRTDAASSSPRAAAAGSHVRLANNRSRSTSVPRPLTSRPICGELSGASLPKRQFYLVSSRLPAFSLVRVKKRKRHEKNVCSCVRALGRAAGALDVAGIPVRMFVLSWFTSCEACASCSLARARRRSVLATPSPVRSAGEVKMAALTAPAPSILTPARCAPRDPTSPCGRSCVCAARAGGLEEVGAHLREADDQKVPA